MEEIKELVILDAEGKEMKCEVLFTFTSDETKKDYIVYTDNTNDEDGNVRVYASIYNKESEKGKLEPITTDKEWEVIETMINEFSASEE